MKLKRWQWTGHTETRGRKMDKNSDKSGYNKYKRTERETSYGVMYLEIFLALNLRLEAHKRHEWKLSRLSCVLQWNEQAAAADDDEWCWRWWRWIGKVTIIFRISCICVHVSLPCDASVKMRKYELFFTNHVRASFTFFRWMRLDGTAEMSRCSLGKWHNSVTRFPVSHPNTRTIFLLSVTSPSISFELRVDNKREIYIYSLEGNLQ